MSHAVSAYDFATARRGYAPGQVERAVTALVGQRDQAWEQLSVLGAGLRGLEAELAAAVQALEDAPPPDYGLLSEQAAGLLAMASAEAAAVRRKAEQDNEQLLSLALQEIQRQSERTAKSAGLARAEADRDAEQILEQARTEAEKLHAEAERESEEIRGAAEQEAALLGERTEQDRKQAEAELAVRLRASNEEAAVAQAREQEIEDRITAIADRQLRESAQHRESVLARVAEIEAEAEVRAERLLERARHDVERITAGAQRDQRTHAERKEQVQVQLDQIRQILATLTGMPTASGTGVAVPTVPGPAAEPVLYLVDPDSDTEEIPLPILPPPPDGQADGTGSPPGTDGDRHTG